MWGRTKQHAGAVQLSPPGHTKVCQDCYAAPDHLHTETYTHITAQVWHCKLHDDNKNKHACKPQLVAARTGTVALSTPRGYGARGRHARRNSSARCDGTPPARKTTTYTVERRITGNKSVAQAPGGLLNSSNAGQQSVATRAEPACKNATACKVQGSLVNTRGRALAWHTSCFRMAACPASHAQPTITPNTQPASKPLH